MGRKSQSKQVSKKSNSGKVNTKLNQQKRKELTLLVDKLLKLTSKFQATVNLTKSWEHYLEISNIVKEICYIESPVNGKPEQLPRQSNIDKFMKWMNDNGSKYNGVEIDEFDGYDLGLKATKSFSADSLLLTVPRKVMISEQDARDSELAPFASIDPLLQNMPNIMLALFLLLEKNKPDSFWKPYIDILPDKYTTVLYFSAEELAELRPSPVFESSLKLYRSIARQYAYFYNKVHTLDLPVLQSLRSIFTFENYRWAVSTVMTRQNNLHLSLTDTTAFIPLWDMCNHEHGKITTDFNKELCRGECYALRDYEPGEQIFIFYGARPNADLFLHNGFVYPKNQHDSLSLSLGVSTSDVLRDTKLSVLSKLGLSAVTHYNLYQGDSPVSPELLAFIRIFNMNQEELTKWSSKSLPSELVSAEEVCGVDRRAYSYLSTRCQLLQAAYKKENGPRENIPDNMHRKNIKLLKECELLILDGAIKYLKNVLEKLPTDEKNTE